MSTPKNNSSKSYKIGQGNINKIRSFLNIQLKEIWLIKRREELSEVGQENLRIIGREAGRINDLLPGGQQ